MNRYFIVLIAILALSSKFGFSASNEEMLKSELAKIKINNPLINEVVDITPIDQHHFNLEAPNHCGEDGTMNPSARVIKCQFHSAGEHEAMVSVCDNEKKYCKQQRLKFHVQQTSSGTPRLEKLLLPDTSKMQKQVKAQLMPGFEEMTPDAGKMAANKKTGLLVMVSAEWCPPCNLVKEFLFPTKEFQQLSSDFQLIYVDGDSPMMDLWRPQVGDPAYPTMVILNKNMKIVAIQAGYQQVKEFSEWITNARKNIDDPIEHVQERVDERIEGSLKRKFLDLFASKEDLIVDQNRLIQYLDTRMKFVEMVQYLQKLQPENYQQKILEAQIQNVMYGDERFFVNTDLSKEDFLNSMGQELLKTSKDKSHWLYNYYLQQECMKNETSYEPVISCKQALLEAIARNNNDLEKTLNNGLESEKVLHKASILSSNSDLLKLLGDENQAKTLKKECFDNYSHLTKYSPLAEKSRASRMYSLECLDSKDVVHSEKLLLSLTKDYPFDSTFLLATARHYLTNKKLKKAKKFNEEAINYSYGDNWVKAKMQQASIEKAMGKKQQARQTLMDSLKEIRMESSDRRTQGWLSRLRAQLDALESEK